MTGNYTKIWRLCAVTVFIDIGNAVPSGELQAMTLNFPPPIKDITSAHAVATNMYTYRWCTDKTFQFRPLVNFPAGYSGSCAFVYMTAS